MTDAEAIIEAAQQGDAEKVRGILDRDPTFSNAESPQGWTALHLAGYFGKVEIVKLLLKAGANVKAVSRNKEANMPLHASLAGQCDRQIIELLLDSGADVNAKAANDVAPIHLAASRGNQELVDYLRSRGADLRSRLANGQTAAEIAQSRGHLDLSDHLRSLS